MQVESMNLGKGDRLELSGGQEMDEFDPEPMEPRPTQHSFRAAKRTKNPKRGHKRHPRSIPITSKYLITRPNPPKLKKAKLHNLRKNLSKSPQNYQKSPQRVTAYPTTQQKPQKTPRNTQKGPIKLSKSKLQNIDIDQLKSDLKVIYNQLNPIAQRSLLTQRLKITDLNQSKKSVISGIMKKYKLSDTKIMQGQRLYNISYLSKKSNRFKKNYQRVEQKKILEKEWKIKKLRGYSKKQEAYENLVKLIRTGNVVRRRWFQPKIGKNGGGENSQNGVSFEQDSGRETNSVGKGGHDGGGRRLRRRNSRISMISRTAEIGKKQPKSRLQSSPQRSLDPNGGLKGHSVEAGYQKTQKSKKSNFELDEEFELAGKSLTSKANIHAMKGEERPIGGVAKALESEFTQKITSRKESESNVVIENLGDLEETSSVKDQQRTLSDLLREEKLKISEKIENEKNLNFEPKNSKISQGGAKAGANGDRESSHSSLSDENSKKISLLIKKNAEENRSKYTSKSRIGHDSAPIHHSSSQIDKEKRNSSVFVEYSKGPKIMDFERGVATERVGGATTGSSRYRGASIPHSTAKNCIKYQKTKNSNFH